MTDARSPWLNVLWVGFALAAIAELLLRKTWSGEGKSLAFFLVATIGFNSSHVGLTPILLRLPEYKRLFGPTAVLSRALLKILSFSPAVLLFALWIADLLPWQSPLLPTAIGFALYQVALTFHAQMQTKGLQLLHFPRGDRQSARAFTVLFFITAIFVFIETFRPDRITAALIALTIAGQLSAIVYIYTRRARLAFEYRRAYTFFCGRLLLWPLSVVSLCALLGVLSLHGLEYAAVTGAIFSNSSLAENRRRRMKLLAMVLIAFLCILALGIPSWNFSPAEGLRIAAEKPLVLKALFAGLVFVTSMHILLDSVIFRYRHPEIAGGIKPLLLGPEPKDLK